MKQSSNSTGSRIARGKLVARLLTGSWGGSKLSVSPAEVDAIADLITACGAGGLGWNKIRNSDLVSSDIAELFRSQYRFQLLQGLIRERQLKKAIPLMRAAGVEPLLVKGWAIARLYPDPGMRPYIDLDLCVRPADYGRADEVLRSGECDDCRIDLHNGFGKFYERRTDAVFARSRVVKLDDLDIRVLGPEDDLRFLCMHLLRHGAVQPLWLCDVALLLETRAPDFDWELCLAGSRREADWVASALALANRLLGVNLDGTPVAGRARNLPDWFVSTVLENWGMPLKTLPLLAGYVRNPRRWLRELPKELPRHWPNAIEATMTVRGPFNRLPRLPFQIAHVISRTTSLLTQTVMGIGNAVLHRS